MAVLLALADAGDEWRHGYDIATQADIKSGTLYPLLMRLEAQGQLEAVWQESPTPGRPPRHAYRLTQAGRAWLAGMGEALDQARARRDAMAPQPGLSAAAKTSASSI
ncbi:DNA-binding PadR family transcriptional regulator [Paucibacter oligotrophus]|uniref:DNA-binding PadR family transcriptional regulator n=1 Tax=Roseateles oligotrophus TaxID=1769250 RepID=A0A840LCM8_9BURK|nr:PadR family transcriptional regulator [Roseateles oligotrophus]MBB4845916.1 DNA-binding PadR family transcriptional regulator [Roseateles oligotrophus]